MGVQTQGTLHTCRASRLRSLHLSCSVRVSHALWKMVKGNKKGLRQTGSVAIQIQIFDETRSPWFSKTSLGLTSIAKDF